MAMHNDTKRAITKAKVHGRRPEPDALRRNKAVLPVALAMLAAARNAPKDSPQRMWSELVK